MKSLRVHAWGEPPRLDDIAPPERAPGQSVVRMRAASVGHIDHTIWGGNFALRPPLPYVPGTEAAGEVIESDRFPAGARVWLRGGGLGTRGDGCWREVIATPDETMGPLPDAVPFALGASFFSPCTAAWCSLNDLGRWQPGERVLVTGASGAVGSIAVQLAKAAGAEVVAVIGNDRGNRVMPGVDTVRLEGLKPDAQLLIDTVGGDVLPQALRGIAPGGRAVLVGYTAGTELRVALPQLMLGDVALLPLNTVRREAAARQLVPELLARLADGRLQLAVQEFPFAQGIRLLPSLGSQRTAGRPVLVSG
jgi:NADPH:quinone reductase